MGEGTYVHPCLLQGVVWQKPTQHCKLNTPVRKITQSLWREELHCVRSSSLLGRGGVLLPSSPGRKGGLRAAQGALGGFLPFMLQVQEQGRGSGGPLLVTAIFTDKQ